MSDFSPARVLVADDSATVRALVRLQLEAAGYEVLEAEDGRQAVDAVSSQSLDAVLLDVEMPVMDGLEADDQVLREVAHRLQESVRTEDLLGRWGGEELLVLAPHTDLEEARLLAERLRGVVSAPPVRSARGDVSVTISIGGATIGDRGHQVDEVLRAADEQLYAAKRAGRDRVHLALLTPSQTAADLPVS